MSNPVPPQHNDNAFNLQILWEGFKPLDTFVNNNLVKFQKTADSALTNRLGDDLNFETVQKVGMVALLVVAALHVGGKRTVLCVLATGSVSVLPTAHLVRRFLCTKVDPQDVQVNDYIILKFHSFHSADDKTPVTSGAYERVKVIIKEQDELICLTEDGQMRIQPFALGPVLKEPRYAQALDSLSFFGTGIVDMDDYVAVGALALLAASAALINIRFVNMGVLCIATQHLLREYAADQCTNAQHTILKWITDKADFSTLSADDLTPHHNVYGQSKLLSPPLPASRLPSCPDGYGNDALTLEIRKALHTTIADFIEAKKNGTENQFIQQALMFGAPNQPHLWALGDVNLDPLNIRPDGPQSIGIFAQAVVRFRQTAVDILADDPLMRRLEDLIGDQDHRMRITMCMWAYQAAAQADRAQLIREIQSRDFFPNINWDDAWDAQYEAKYDGERQYAIDLKALFTDLEQVLAHDVDGLPMMIWVDEDQ